MLHTMKLKKEPFEKIKNGSKTVELRLNDEKRQKVQVGDFIEFSCLDNGFDAYNFAGGFRFYDAVRNDKALNKKSTPCGMDN